MKIPGHDCVFDTTSEVHYAIKKFTTDGPKFTPEMEYPNLLIFAELPDPDEPTLGLLKTLSYMDVTLVGFARLDEDESADDVSAERREQLLNELEDLVTDFEEHGIRVDTELAFGTDMEMTREEYAQREQIDGVLLMNDVSTVGRILVPVRDRDTAEDIAHMVDFLDRDKIVHVTLLHVAEGDTPPERGHEVLEHTRDLLADRGVNPHAVDLQVRISDDPEIEILKTAPQYDMVVLGQTEEGAEERVFGSLANQVVDRTGVPVLVIA